MRFKIEADPELGLIRYWWTQDFKGKPYGQFMRIRLPIDHLEPYTEALKRSHADAMATLASQEEDDAL